MNKNIVSKIVKGSGVLFKYLRANGLKKTLVNSLCRMFSDKPAAGVHVYEMELYLKNSEIDICPQDKNTIPFVWYVPAWTNVWGGGHLTIFRFAHFLSKRGHVSYIYVYNTTVESTLRLESDLQKAFPGNALVLILDPAHLPAAHIAFATTWDSAYQVIKTSKNEKKFYFMQDYESYFFAYGTESMQAIASYAFGFQGITGGSWLKRCYEQHGGKADNYVFSVDPQVFYAKQDVGSPIKRLFYYCRPRTTRRAYALGVEILRQINKKYPDIEILIAGMDGLPPFDFPAKLLGNLTLAQTGELYRTCDVGIALSATNLSYLPVELMACGVPVISNNGPNVEWFCENLQDSLLCNPFPSCFIAALDRLIESPALRLSLVENGLKKIAQTTWEKEVEKVYAIIRESI
jgi:glycosyltransferase involved in cell wall biosynthesis